MAMEAAVMAAEADAAVEAALAAKAYVIRMAVGTMQRRNLQA